jgi:hypothetical protein
MPVIPALWRLRQEDRESKTSLGSIVSSRPACTRQQNPVSKSQGQDRRWWLTPLILATQEAEIRRIAVQSQPGQIVLETLFWKKTQQKKDWCGDSNGIVAVWQVWGPDFKPQYCQNKQAKKLAHVVMCEYFTPFYCQIMFFRKHKASLNKLQILSKLWV